MMNFQIVITFLLTRLAFTQPPASNAIMTCSECLMFGYNFCYKDKDHTEIFSTDTSTTQSFCIRQLPQLQNETKFSFDDFICTNHYNNSVYARFACPQDKDLCGDGNITLSSKNSE